MLFFFTGRAYKDDDGKVYLALKDFDFERIGETGLALQWLVDELEKCPAKEKLLLLDCSHAGAGADLAMEPSAEEMLGSLKHLPGRGPLRTVTAIASCKAGQRSVDWPEKQHGLFAWLLAEGYAGQADKNHDNRVEPTELFGYLQDAMAAARRATEGVADAGACSCPTIGPRGLPKRPRWPSANWRRTFARTQPKQTEAKADYDAAAQAAGEEPEPRLLWGLLLLKSAQRDPSSARRRQSTSRRLRLNIPTRFCRCRASRGCCSRSGPISRASRSWRKWSQRFPSRRSPTIRMRRPTCRCSTGSARFASLPPLTPETPEVVGRGARRSSMRPSPDMVPTRKRSYEEGRAKSRTVRDDFQKRIDEADAAGGKAMTLKATSRQVDKYVIFPVQSGRPTHSQRAGRVTCDRASCGEFARSPSDPLASGPFVCYDSVLPRSENHE